MQIDKAILSGCLANQRKAQQELYRVLLPYLRAIATRYLKDNSYVKDVLQESFIKIFKNLEKYNSDKAPLKSWAARIVVNASLNYNQRQIGESSDEIDPESREVIVFPQIIGELSNADILNVLKTMPSNYYEVFNLSVIDGYSHEEIATLLNITAPLSRKRLSRARIWLAKTFPDKSRYPVDEYSLPRTINKH